MGEPPHNREQRIVALPPRAAAAGAVAAATLGPFLVMVARRGSPGETVPANRLLT